MNEKHTPTVGDSSDQELMALSSGDDASAKSTGPTPSGSSKKSKSVKSMVITSSGSSQSDLPAKIGNNGHRKSVRISKSNGNSHGGQHHHGSSSKSETLSISHGNFDPETTLKMYLTDPPDGLPSNLDILAGLQKGFSGSCVDNTKIRVSVETLVTHLVDVSKRDVLNYERLDKALVSLSTVLESHSSQLQDMSAKLDQLIGLVVVKGDRDGINNSTDKEEDIKKKVESMKAEHKVIKRRLKDLKDCLQNGEDGWF